MQFSENWLLPPDPASFSGDEMCVKNICDRALRLLAKKGGDREHGVDYREFLLLAARSIERNSTRNAFPTSCNATCGSSFPA